MINLLLWCVPSSTINLEPSELIPFLNLLFRELVGDLDPPHYLGNLFETLISARTLCVTSLRHSSAWLPRLSYRRKVVVMPILLGGGGNERIYMYVGNKNKTKQTSTLLA